MYEIKIPDVIKIGGFDYSVVHSKENDIELKDANLWGSHSERLRRIELNTEASSQQKSATFIHECLHAIDTVYLNGQIDDHKIIRGLESGLHQILEQLGVRFVR